MYIYTLARKKAEINKNNIYILIDNYRINSGEFDVETKKSRKTKRTTEIEQVKKKFSKSIVVIVVRKQLNYNFFIIVIYLLYKIIYIVIVLFAVATVFVEIL